MSPIPILLPRREVRLHPRYSPKDIANILFWHRADMTRDSLNAPLANGAQVINWLDLSGNGYTATVHAAGPTFIAASGINGMPAVAMPAGTNNYFDLSASPNYPSGGTVFAVHIPAITASYGILGGTTGSSYLTWRFITSGGLRLSGLAGATTIGASTAIKTAGNTYISAFDYANTSGGAWHHFNNGAADGNGTSTVTTSGGTASRIGFGNSVYNGTIAEVISYSRVLNATERAQVHSYLSDRYGIAVSDYAAW